MVEGKRKSRSMRRTQVRTPKHTVIRYTQRKPSKAQCGRCGAYLHGMTHTTATKQRNIAKTKKRPERPYGGVFCSRCSRQLLIARVIP